MKKVFIYSIIVSLVLAAIIAVHIFLFGKFGDTQLRLLFTTLTMGGYSVTALSSAALYHKRKYKYFALFGILVSLTGFFLTVSGLWGNPSYEMDQAIISFMILAPSIAQGSLLLSIESNRLLINVCLAMTLSWVAIIALMIIFIIFYPNLEDDEFYFRLIGALGVLDVLGTIVTPLLKKFTGKEVFDSTLIPR